MNKLLRRVKLLQTSGYGTSTMGACQKAAFCPDGSSTVTWQSYLPGARLFRPMLKCSGMIFTRLFEPSDTLIGGVSNAFVCPR